MVERQPLSPTSPIDAEELAELDRLQNLVPYDGHGSGGIKLPVRLIVLDQESTPFRPPVMTQKARQDRAG